MHRATSVAVLAHVDSGLQCKHACQISRRSNNKWPSYDMSNTAPKRVICNIRAKTPTLEIRQKSSFRPSAAILHAEAHTDVSYRVTSPDDVISGFIFFDSGTLTWPIYHELTSGSALNLASTHRINPLK